MSVITLNTLEELQEALQNEEVFIKVSSSTCAPCKMMSPLFEKVSEEASSGDFYSIEVDSVTSELAQYAQNVLSISTVPVFFKYTSGTQDKRVSGAFPKTQLVSKLDIKLT